MTLWPWLSTSRPCHVHGAVVSRSPPPSLNGALLCVCPSGAGPFLPHWCLSTPIPRGRLRCSVPWALFIYPQPFSSLCPAPGRAVGAADAMVLETNSSCPRGVHRLPEKTVINTSDPVVLAAKEVWIFTQSHSLLEISCPTTEGSWSLVCSLAGVPLCSELLQLIICHTDDALWLLACGSFSAPTPGTFPLLCVH